MATKKTSVKHYSYNAKISVKEPTIDPKPDAAASATPTVKEQTPGELASRISTTLAKYSLEEVNAILRDITQDAANRVKESVVNAEKERDRVIGAHKEFLTLFNT